jgi:hypothetical protein
MDWISKQYTATAREQTITPDHDDVAMKLRT